MVRSSNLDTISEHSRTAHIDCESEENTAMNAAMANLNVGMPAGNEPEKRAGTAKKGDKRHGGAVANTFQRNRMQVSQSIIAIQHPNPPVLFAGVNPDGTLRPGVKPLPFQPGEATPTNEGIDAVGQQQPPRPFNEHVYGEPIAQMSGTNRRVQSLYMLGTHYSPNPWLAVKDLFDVEGYCLSELEKPYNQTNVRERKQVDAARLDFARKQARKEEEQFDPLTGNQQTNELNVERARLRRVKEDSEASAAAQMDAEAAVAAEDGALAAEARAVENYQGPGGGAEDEELKADRLQLNDNSDFQPAVDAAAKALQAANPIQSLTGGPTRVAPLSDFLVQARRETIRDWPEPTEAEARAMMQAAAAIKDIDGVRRAAEQLLVQKGLTKTYKEVEAQLKKRGKVYAPSDVYRAMGRTYPVRDDQKIRANGDTLRDISYRLTGLHRSQNLQNTERDGAKPNNFPLMQKLDFPSFTDLGFTQHERRKIDKKYKFIDGENKVRDVPFMMVSDRDGNRSFEDQGGDIEVVWFATLQDRAHGILHQTYLDPESDLTELDRISRPYFSYHPATTSTRVPAVWRAGQIAPVHRDWKTGGKFHGKRFEYKTWEDKQLALRAVDPNAPPTEPPPRLANAYKPIKRDGDTDGMLLPRTARGEAQERLEDWLFEMDTPTVRQLESTGAFQIPTVPKDKIIAQREGTLAANQQVRSDKGQTFYNKNLMGAYVLSYALYPADEFRASRIDDPTEQKKLEARSEHENRMAEKDYFKSFGRQKQQNRAIRDELGAEWNERVGDFQRAQADAAGPEEIDENALEREEARKMAMDVYPVIPALYTAPVDEMWEAIIDNRERNIAPGPSSIPPEDNFPYHINWPDEAWMHPRYEKDGHRFEPNEEFTKRRAEWEAKATDPNRLPWEPQRHEASYYRYVKIAPYRVEGASERARRMPHDSAAPASQKIPWGSRRLEAEEEWNIREEDWTEKAGELVSYGFGMEDAAFQTAIIQMAAQERDAADAREKEARTQADAEAVTRRLEAQKRPREE